MAKWIEAACYTLVTHPDRKIEKLVNSVIKKIMNAQQDDGYLNMYFTNVEPENRWKNLRDWHELYCAGHLMEAAIAHYDATGNRDFLDVMCRYADHIDKTFGPGKGKKRGYPGHQEIELALMKLYRVTGEERYKKLASFFIDERGRKPHYYDKEMRARGEKAGTWVHKTYKYSQAHIPVREQKEVVGHAVRALYMYCGMADVAKATGDAALVKACQCLWDNLCQKRMFITGGVLRGAGDTLTQMFITLCALWFVRIPTSAFLSSRIGTTGIWWGIPAGWLVGFFISFVYFLGGRWKRKVVAEPLSKSASVA